MQNPVEKTGFTELLAQCESEKLHLSGGIQSFGALLRVDAVNQTITHASANLEEFMGVPALSLLGQSAASIDWLNLPHVGGLATKPGCSLRLPLLPGAQGAFVDVQLIRIDGGLLVEIEHHVDAPIISLQELQRPLFALPAGEPDLENYHQALLDGFDAVAGFDRVMVYRFREDWSGEVLAERTAAACDGYLGQRFPASDIPEIARKLYMQNPCRSIPDARAKPVQVISADGTPPDLTCSDLRSVSPVHLVYLANMDVAASFSVPIRVAGRLWGLVACHHRDPRVLSRDQRNAAVSLTNTYSLGLTSYYAGRRLQSIDSMDRRIDRLLEALAGYDNPLDGIEPHGDLLADVLGATGFAMAINENVILVGEAPSLEEMAQLDHWFLAKSGDSLFASNHLAEFFPEQSSLLDTVSGMVAIKARSVRSGWVRFYWFRQAEPQEVVWAGNPNKPVIKDELGLRISPRLSFERWVEVKTGYSRPWSNEEKMTATKFRNTLLRWL